MDYNAIALNNRRLIARFDRLTPPPLPLEQSPRLCETWDKRQERFAATRAARLARSTP